MQTNAKRKVKMHKPTKAKKSDVRPAISSITASAELRRWYWLKTELAAEAKRLGVKCTGAKFTILERLCHLLDTGNQKWPGDTRTVSRSTFDWHSSKLTNKTVITDSYKNTQNVRRYFQANVDPKFKFNIGLMDWIKANAGKTLGDAGNYWQAQQDDTAPTQIKPHNQFNQYTRDFLQDNPNLGMQDARKFWALKKARPTKTGRHVYARSDLKLHTKK